MKNNFALHSSIIHQQLLLLPIFHSLTFSARLPCTLTAPSSCCRVSFVPCAHFLFPTWQVLYSDSFRKQVQGKAAYVLDTPEMRRVRETQKHISTVRAFMGVLNWQ